MKNKLFKHMKKIREFGIKVAFASISARLYSFASHPNRLSWELNNFKHKVIKAYLKKNYSYIIDKYSNRGKRDEEIHDQVLSPSNNEEQIIWTVWWQGEDEMPDVIKLCHQSVVKNSVQHPVVVITKNNFHEYIDLPEQIVSNFESGIISFTHLSDIIRMYLLSHYGGLWLDASIYVAGPISDCVFSLQYYTVKNNPYRISCISNGRWVGGVTCANKGNVFTEYMYEFFCEYWKEHNCLIDYFLIDYMTCIALEGIESFKEMYDAVPYNNSNIFQLEKELNEKWDEAIFDKMKLDSTFFRFSWKNKYMLETKDGNETIYAHLVRESR